jgi:hypothetical protein
VAAIKSFEGGDVAPRGERGIRIVLGRRHRRKQARALIDSWIRGCSSR